MEIDTIIIPPTSAKPQSITLPKPDTPLRMSPDSPDPTPVPRQAKRMLEDAAPSTPINKRTQPIFITPDQPKSIRKHRSRRSSHQSVQSTANTDGESDSYSLAGSDMEQEQEGESEKEVGGESDLEKDTARKLIYQSMPTILNPGVTAIQREAGEPDTWSVVSSDHASEDLETASQCSLPNPDTAQSILGKSKGQKSKTGRGGTGGAIPKYRGPGQVTPRKKGRGKLTLSTRPKE